MKFSQSRRVFFGVISSTFLSACALVSLKAKSAAELEPNETASSSMPKLKESVTLFQHGVASGDPQATSVVLWTRLSIDAFLNQKSSNQKSNNQKPTSQESAQKIGWQMSKDKKFKHIIQTGELTTGAQADYTAKVVVDDLEAGHYYYYRFVYGSVRSPVGRTKTLPVGRVDKLGIALASCANHAFGYFNAYDAIANDQNIDILLHTGDYIYEYGVDGWGGDVSRELGREHLPAHETVSLQDYRQRHAQYKLDAGSKAVHAAHPIVCCWDDHESANNPWSGGAQNHQDDIEGDWSTRRQAAVQAYYEWMPIRDPIDDDLRLEFSRNYQFGDLASLVTLETRHAGRAQQIEYSDYAKSITTKEDADKFKTDVLQAPNRPMLSDESEDLFKQSLTQSLAQQQAWRLVGNASPIAKLLVPDVEGLGLLDGETTEQLNSYFGKGLRWQAKYNLPQHTDAWDGYGWARERLYTQSRELGVQDLLFLTGDSHSFLMNRLFDEQQRPMGLEIGTTAISSPGGLLGVGWNEETVAKLEKAFIEENDEIVWTNNFYQGYVRVELTPQQAEVSYIGVNTVLSSTYDTQVVKRTVIKKNGESIDYSTT